MKYAIIFTLIFSLFGCKKYEQDEQRPDESVKMRLCNKEWKIDGRMSAQFYRGGDYWQQSDKSTNALYAFAPVVQWKLSIDRNYINFKTVNSKWQGEILKLTDNELILSIEGKEIKYTR